MRRMRKRRLGMWLPPDATANKVGPGDPQVGPGPIVTPVDVAIGVLQNSVVSKWGSTVGTEVPLIGDVKPNVIAGLNGQTLNDFSFGYSLQRVVGGIWVAVQQQDLDQGNGAPYDILCTAGIMVRRVDDAGSPIQIGGPQLYDAYTDPWLWRRSWMLTNQPQAVGSGGYYPFPSNNGAYGSVREGTHVDQKTRRTVKLEERVFMSLQATVVGPITATQAGTNTGLFWAWDLRFFGRVFNTSGNRRNASR